VRAEERQGERRDRLRAAGLQLFGTVGYATTTIADICVEAGLNRRYFYEAYRTREDLLRDVYDQFVASIAAEVIDAVSTRDQVIEKVQAGQRAFWGRATQDPREVRILTIEVVGVSEPLERRRREVRHGFADFIRDQAITAAERHGWIERVDLTVAARVIVGASIDLLVDWVRGDTAHTPAELADLLAGIFAGAAADAFVTRGGRTPAQLRRKPSRSAAEQR
jgi:AcrR family transcriptional regulator